MREIEETDDISEMVLASFTDPQVQENITIPQTLSFPGLDIHLKEQTVYKDGVLIPLSHYEFFTLYYLAKHPGWVFTKEQIYEAVWKQPSENCETSVTNVISHIRRKLNQKNSNAGYIKTVVNSGYKFEI